MASRLPKILFFFLLLPIALGVAGWQGWTWWSWATSPVKAEIKPISDSPEGDAAEVSNPTPASETVQIQIPQGTPGQQIGRDLEAAGLIRSHVAWNVWSRWQNLRQDVGYQAGTYALSPAQSMQDIAQQIRLGDVLESSFTIPEGWTREQMAIAFEDRGFFSAAAFLEVTQQIPRDRYPWLPQNLPHLEGFLYPDTYSLPAETVTPEGIRDLMLSRFETVALPVYQQNGSDFSLLEWVTLSSIVEREAVIPEERSEIAAVFNRRLEEGIALGADPTVEYGLGITQTPEQPLTLNQVNTPSPYNTYLNPGLPPTPIAAPGLASLEASLNPPDTIYLYFVARYDGTHVFSRTLAEHEAAQARIRDAIDAQGTDNTTAE
ncbi:endolytic transglycosylase MltG [Oscillatoria sp. CS-180]|uniref:endolytic transglycosylase MltG n=1 Tax=Oscillatoria sp. CS-180 TaxID=3021720 RepID=UPI00232CFCCB|nr:endolytic transglycosylase MltG [Oscillatoria sp. CS-180]MDB9528617.1 endolytic transglycosylase MltG [Oscillatoria sp. CS-180]